MFLVTQVRRSFLHGRKPRPLQSWYQSYGLALGKQMNITKGKIGIKVHT